MKWHLLRAKSTKIIALVTMRITAGANTWMKAEGVMGDRRITRKLKGNVFSSCYPGTHERTEDDGTNRETTGEGPVLRKTIVWIGAIAPWPSL